ncbi:hypothetical protein NDU88_001220 [Pleurodeles waltl]|uniref:Uncharacterized protein n=1 Tax=Pleurodeles waltl TaxID=8319 RepID=A0AAV7RC70_PLEWA|nr:hypothetical protein NDU88_001220 [Pleurodeles waltl]
MAAGAELTSGRRALLARPLWVRGATRVLKEAGAALSARSPADWRGSTAPARREGSGWTGPPLHAHFEVPAGGSRGALPHWDAAPLIWKVRRALACGRPPGALIVTRSVLGARGVPGPCRRRRRGSRRGVRTG